DYEDTQGGEVDRTTLGQRHPLGEPSHRAREGIYWERWSVHRGCTVGHGHQNCFGVRRRVEVSPDLLEELGHLSPLKAQRPVLGRQQIVDALMLAHSQSSSSTSKFSLVSARQNISACSKTGGLVCTSGASKARTTVRAPRALRTGMAPRHCVTPGT